MYSQDQDIVLDKHHTVLTWKLNIGINNIVTCCSCHVPIDCSSNAPFVEQNPLSELGIALSWLRPIPKSVRIELNLKG